MTEKNGLVVAFAGGAVRGIPVASAWAHIPITAKNGAGWTAQVDVYASRDYYKGGSKVEPLINPFQFTFQCNPGESVFDTAYRVLKTRDDTNTPGIGINFTTAMDFLV